MKKRERISIQPLPFLQRWLCARLKIKLAGQINDELWDKLADQQYNQLLQMIKYQLKEK